MKLKFCLIFLILSLIFSFKLLSQNSINNKLIKPEYLTKGDTVAIVAPSGVLKNYNNYIDKAKELLSSWELNVIIGKNVFNDSGHFSGTDEERTLDFQIALDDKSVKAIWCARGGYGAMRVIDNLNFEKYKQNPKWIVGYSDITAIHSDLHIENSESIHAIMSKSLNELNIDNDESVLLLKKTLFGEKLSYQIKGNPYNIEGDTKGQLVGGNLTLLHCLLGSESSINTDGKILFIEDLGEYLYHIDRMLLNLKRNKKYNNLKALIVGGMTNLHDNEIPFGKSYEQIILEYFGELSIPICFNFPSGHLNDNRAIKLGCRADLEITEKEVTFIQK